MSIDSAEPPRMNHSNTWLLLRAYAFPVLFFGALVVVSVLNPGDLNRLPLLVMLGVFVASMAFFWWMRGRVRRALAQRLLEPAPEAAIDYLTGKLRRLP